MIFIILFVIIIILFCIYKVVKKDDDKPKEIKSIKFSDAKPKKKGWSLYGDGEEIKSIEVK